MFTREPIERLWPPVVVSVATPVVRSRNDTAIPGAGGVPVSPLIPVNAPPARIFPSCCTARLRTVSFITGKNVASSVPSWLRRATRDRGVPLMLVKSPPMRILPSGWMLTAATVLFAPVPGVKVLSRVPSALRRTMRLTVTPPKLVNEPTTSTLPMLVPLV